MAERTCTHDACDAELYAKGLCRRHYKQTRPRTPDVLETVACDGCGENYQRPKRKHRYQSSYCSLLCRDYTRWGGQSCDLPAGHWARTFGSTCPWAPPLVRNTGECEWCGEPNPRSTTAAYCSIECKRHAKSRRRRAAEHGAPGLFRYSEVMRQYRRQGSVCAYCETAVDGLPDPEHVVPLSRRGRNDMSNIVAACRACNSDKRDLLLSEWNSDRIRRGKEPVRTNLVGPAFAHLIPQGKVSPLGLSRDLRG